jgi:hypothetical protein
VTRVALGFRAHSGWAALVVLAGPPEAPVVVDRRRIELADAAIEGSKQPYHAAEGRKPREAERLLARCMDRSRALARAGLRAVVEELSARDHRVVGCGVLLGSGRALPADVHKILASHALIHAAEGEMYRDVLVRAGEQLSLRVTGVRERDVLARAGEATGRPGSELQRRVAEMGRRLGPPWRQDEKLATLVAWVALASDQ